MRLGVINVSDRASAGFYKDLPGKAVVALLEEWITTPFKTAYAVIPDEQSQIEAQLRQFADVENCSLILTTGGTGPAVRDVTPEATETVCQKMLPGKPKAIGECLEAVFPATPYCIDLIEGPLIKVDSSKIKIFRPSLPLPISKQ